MKCAVCSKSGEGHHILTQKAYPNLKFSKFNIIPLCREHHSEWHNKAMIHMADTYFPVKVWLINNGWSYCETKKKWVPPSYT